MRFKRLSFEEVVFFVIGNSECELLSTEYHNNREKLRFRCVCGNEFETSFNKFRDQNKRQCNECGKELNNYSKRLTIEYVRNFVEENSNCVLLSDEYKNNHTKLKFGCSCGSIFYTGFDNFVYQETRQCLECANKNRTKDKVLTIDEVKTRVEENGNSVLLSTEYINAQRKLKFQCKCGNIYSRSWNGFNNGQGYCLECSKKHSKGEDKIKIFLESKNIKFNREYTFDGCKFKRKLPFDFYLPDLNTCIEYDGEFHFDTDRIPFGNPSLQQKRDAIKTKFCKDNHIKLIRIPYYDFNRIEEILETAI